MQVTLRAGYFLMDRTLQISGRIIEALTTPIHRRYCSMLDSCHSQSGASQYNAQNSRFAWYHTCLEIINKLKCEGFLKRLGLDSTLWPSGPVGPVHPVARARGSLHPSPSGDHETLALVNRNFRIACWRVGVFQVGSSAEGRIFVK